MSLVIAPIEAQTRIANFLSDMGVGAEVVAKNDGGPDYGDLEFLAKITPSTDDVAITNVLNSDDLGPAFSFSYVARRRELFIYVAQPTASQSYELEKWFIRNA